MITVSWSVGQTHLCWSGGGSHPAPSLHRQVLILSIRGILFRLTPSRINSFPNGFYFICSLIINFINGQAGNATLLFLFFLQYFSDVHFSYFHVDVFHGKFKERAHMQEAHTRSMCYQGRTAHFPVVPAQDRAPHVRGLSVSLAAADRKGKPQLAGL